MRVRAQSDSGDYTFGRSQGNFLVNSPATVAQLVETFLRLLEGEWYLDTTAGTPWTQDVVGVGRANVYDMVIQAAILSVQGVTSIVAYSSNLDGTTRRLTVQAVISTIYDTAAEVGGGTQVGGNFIIGQSSLGGGDVLGP